MDWGDCCTYTTAKTATPNVADILTAVSAMKAAVPPALTVYTHSENLGWWERRIGTSGLFGIEVHTCDYLPVRRTRQVWRQPMERFFEYGTDPETEAACRALGIGTVETVDDGPYMLVLKGRPGDWMRDLFRFPQPLLTTLVV